MKTTIAFVAAFTRMRAGPRILANAATMLVLVVVLRSLVPFNDARASEKTNGSVDQKAPKVTAPPELFFERFKEKDREAARVFYKKHIDANGLSIAAGADVADAALERTYHIVIHMLAGRPDILDAMRKYGTRLIIIGKDQVYTDMPEYRNHPNPIYQNERVRGTGGLAVTSFGEENLLNLAFDRYDDESIAVHDFCHTVDAALRSVDAGWR